MIIRAKFQGTFGTLSFGQLRQLRNAALYRGLDATAHAIKRELVRRNIGPTVQQEHD